MVGFKKKNDLVKTEEPEKLKSKKADKTTKKSGAASIASGGVQPALIALIIVSFLAFALEILVIQDVEQVQGDRVTAKLSDVVQNDLNSLAADRVKALDAIGKNPSLVDYLLSQDKQVSRDLLRVTLPDLVDYFAVPASDVKQVRALFPSLGFASVDAIRKASPSDPLKLEAFFDGKTWFYQAALSIGGEKPAVILFLFNMSELSRLLTQHAATLNSNLSIASGTQSDAALVTSAGQPASGEPVAKKLNIGTWMLRYSPSTGSLVVIDRMIMWISLAGAALLVCALVFAISRVRLMSIKSDVVLASSLLQAGLSGERKRSDRLKYVETIELLNLANKALVDQESKETAKTSAPLQPSAAPQAMSVQDVPAHDGDDDLNFDDLDLDAELGLESTEKPQETKKSEGLSIEPSIFRAYDIRGIVDETLTDPGVEMIGRALASEALAKGFSTLCVGYDGRLSSERYCEAICRGITSTGADAIVIGRVPTPVLYFATHQLETGTGVMITGSHNPGNYNGFKMMIGGSTLSGDDIQGLYHRIVSGDFASGSGSVSRQSVDESYLDTILNDVAVAAPLKVVLDAGNGVAGELAPRLVEELGCEVIPLFCDIDGTFPNHHPDPGKPKNLEDLIAAVAEHEADLGLAFDGDGDRVGVVTNTGKIIWPDRLLMLFAKDVVSRNPGADIIYDVKCSRRLNGLISSFGGRPIMWKTGHSLIKAKMKETGALLAGEMSGHIFFKERWLGFDDGLYSAVRLLEILGIEDRSADEVFAEFPEDVSTPEINIEVSEAEKFSLVEQLCERAPAFEDGNVSTIDGLRVDFADGWGLCRASNTTPVLVLRFEADDEAALKRIQARFKEQLLAVDSSLNIDF